MSETRNLSYRVMKNGTAWGWEFTGPDSEVLAHGSADTCVKARARAMEAGLLWLQRSQGDAEDDDVIGIRH